MGFTDFILPRDRPVITSDNLSPVIQIVTWLLFVAIILSVLVRLITKVIVGSKLGYDDLLISISLLFAIGQTITVVSPGGQEFGRRFESLSSTRRENALKTQFAGELLYIPSLVFAKLSILTFLHIITPSLVHLWAIKISGVIILLWGITSILATAFQCSIPHTWDYIHNTCFNRLRFRTYLSATNIITDVALCVIPIFMVAKLRTSLHRRIRIAACFGSRLLVIVATCTRLWYLHSAASSSDFTFSIWPYVICTQCVQALSIVTACIPYMKPFLESLQSGHLRADDDRRRESTGAYGPKSETPRHTYTDVTLEKWEISCTEEREI